MSSFDFENENKTCLHVLKVALQLFLQRNLLFAKINICNQQPENCTEDSVLFKSSSSATAWWQEHDLKNIYI